MADEEVAVRVENISKTFRLPHERKTSIKSAFINLFRKTTYEKQEALKDISFDIKKGEFFGIVGRNGSGKSTLLKLIAGIYTPTQGSIRINGTLTPFIELGVGFNPELTGRENVFLNGALLGFNRKETEKMYSSIVEFAELEKFMDQKLKNYSSGMQVRLAFSIAIQSKSDMLIFDEVLAVGDASFQRKCFDIFEKYKSGEKTIIFVTHDMGRAVEFCDRAMLLSDGKILDIGNTAKIAAQYDRINQGSIDKQTLTDNQKKTRGHRLKAKILDKDNNPSTSFRYGDTLKVVLEWPKDMNVKDLGIMIAKESGEYIFGTNTYRSGSTKPAGKNKFTSSIKLDIGPGRYRLLYATFGKEKHKKIEFVTDGPSFIILNDDSREWDGLFNLESRWDD